MAKLAIKGGDKIAAELEDVGWPELHPDDEKAVLDALRRDYWGGLGDENLPSAVFEREFARYHDAKHGIVVANGTVSLEISLKAGGVEPGDEVIVPSITFFATASAVVSVGAIPVFVDVDPRTAQIDAKAVEAAITPRTKAVIGVHYGGYPFDLDTILETAGRYKLLVVEDCAHAHGTAWRGKKVGSWGTFGSFSFQHTKTLASGEGGLVLTSDDDLYQYAVLLRNIGRKTGKREYSHYVCASNWRLGGLQGALLLSQFSRFPEQAEKRDRNVRWLARELEKIPGLLCFKEDERITQLGCYYFLVDFDAGEFGIDRDTFIAALRAEGVKHLGIGYERPLYKEPAFSSEKLRPFLHQSIEIPKYNEMRLPNAERWAERQITIEHFYLLGEDRKRAEIVVAAVRKIKENISELAEL